MNAIPPPAMAVLRTLWRRKWLSVGIAWLVCVIGWAGVALIPSEYESTARVYLNSDPVLTPLLRGLAAKTDPARQLDMLRHTLLSRPDLEQLVRLAGLDPRDARPAARSALFNRLAADISVRQVNPNLIGIAYRDRDPVRAKDIVQALLTILAEKMAGSSRAEMDSAQRFLDSEIASYAGQLRAAEQRRAELAVRYPDLVANGQPDASAAGSLGAGARLDLARGAVAKLEGDLAEAVTRRDALRRQLASVPPMLSVDRGAPVVVMGNERLSPEQARLAELRKNLDQLLVKDTEAHPDVIAARAALAQAEAEGRNAPRSGAAPGGIKAQIPNTVYDQLKLRLADADAGVAALQQRLAQAQAEEKRIDKLLHAAPSVLQQVQDLDRDYGVLKKNYEELVARREAAQIASAADTRSEAIQFRIVDPPQVPAVPVSPNRPLLLSLVLLFGVAAGLAAPVALMQIDSSFATIGQLRGLDLPVLGTISRLAIGAERRRAALRTAALGVSVVVLVALYGTLLMHSLAVHSIGIS